MLVRAFEPASDRITNSQPDPILLAVTIIVRSPRKSYQSTISVVFLQDAGRKRHFDFALRSNDAGSTSRWVPGWVAEQLMINVRVVENRTTSRYATERASPLQVTGHEG